MTQPFPIRFFLSAVLSVTGCMISVAAAESDCPSKCDQSDCPVCPLPPLSEASISINRGKIQVYCAKGDSTSECADALSDVIISEGGGSTTVVYATTTSLQCGNTIYTISNGSNGGLCKTNAAEGTPPDYAECQKKGDIVVSVNCKTGCGEVAKGASCLISVGKP